MQNYDGNNLFGIDHLLVQSKIQELCEKMFSKTYTFDNWNNKEIIQYIFKLYLKKYALRNKELWHYVFNSWCNQKSFICKVYSNNREIDICELRT